MVTIVIKMIWNEWLCVWGHCHIWHLVFDCSIFLLSNYLRIFFCQTHFHTFKTDMIMKNFLPSISIEETCKVYLVKTLFCQILYLYIDTHVLIKKTKLQNVDYVVRAS